MIYHIEIDLNFSVIQMVLTMYGLFTVRLGTSLHGVNDRGGHGAP